MVTETKILVHLLIGQVFAVGCVTQVQPVFIENLTTLLHLSAIKACRDHVVRLIARSRARPPEQGTC